MIREQRTREKLRTYYQKFMTQGVMDPNVHPWVAEAWQKSRNMGVSAKKFGPFVQQLCSQQLLRCRVGNSAHNIGVWLRNILINF